MTTEETSPNWLELPRDITASILKSLGPVEILNTAQRVCPHWRSISMEPSLWTTVDMRDVGDGLFCDQETYRRLCLCAVERCNGGLVELSISQFGTDELLRDVTASCNGIKRLRLISCYDATDEGLAEAVAKLPLLEDLELSFNLFSDDALVAIGLHCSSLKSLKFNCRVRASDLGLDEQALAIANTMPELRHLQLLGNRLTNVGLEAILSGCPLLEDLDLRRCRHVDLGGELGKRCAERIKNLRRPSDPTDDLEYLAELQLNDYFDDSGDCWYDDYGSNLDYYRSISDQYYDPFGSDYYPCHGPYGSDYDDYGSCYDECGSEFPWLY